MATTTSKKPAAKKPAAKKPAAAKPAAKKPAAKTAAKKPAAKKPAAAKPAAKKPAVKKPAVAKKPAAKKPAATKPAVKKPVAAAKPAAKKPAAPKSAVKKPADAKKPAAVKKPVEKKAVAKKPTDAPESVIPVPPGIKLMDLFDAYLQEKLPRENGYIVSAFFSPNSAYSIYEVVSYSGVKEIRFTGTGLEFVTGGKKLSILVEPASYSMKHVEPVSRRIGERIEKRYSELEIITAKNQSKIMIAKEPNETYGTFTILKPTGINFSRVLYNLDDVYETLKILFEVSFNKEALIPQSDAKIAATLIARIVEKTMSFKGDFM